MTSDGHDPGIPLDEVQERGRALVIITRELKPGKQIVGRVGGCAGNFRRTE
jgi:lipid-binding SYLF domain-containing protein